MAGIAAYNNFEVCPSSGGNFTTSFDFFERLTGEIIAYPGVVPPNANDTVVHCSLTLPGPSPDCFFSGYPHFACNVTGYQITLNGGNPQKEFNILSLVSTDAGPQGGIVSVEVADFNSEGIYTGPTSLSTYTIVP